MRALPPQRTRAALYAGALAGLILGTPRAARAQVSTDAPLLTELVTQGGEALQTLGESLRTAKRQYQELQELAGYALDARNMYAAFMGGHGGASGSEIEASVEAMFPEVSYFRREASRPGPWAEGTGALQRMLTVCVGQVASGRACVQVEEALHVAQVRSAVEATFGSSSDGPRGAATRAVDDEVVSALAESSASSQRLTVLRARLLDLEDGCRRKNDEASCRAAADLATMISAEAELEAASDAANAQRLQAVQLAQQNGAHKEEVDAAGARDALLQSATDAVAAPPVVKSDGYDLFGEGPSP